MINLKKQNVLFFARTMGLGGTENVILQLCEVFKPFVNKIVVCSSGGVNEEKLKAMGIKHYTIGDPIDKSLNNVIRNSKALKKIVADENITLIHTHHRMAAFYVRFTGLYKKCSFVNTSHNTFYDKKRLTRYAYKHAALIACGEMVKKNLTDFYGLENVSVVHNAVKAFEDKIKPCEILVKARNEGKFLIGNVGRLSEQKGMEYFIKAVPSVIKEHPDAEFFIVGTGEDELKLKAMAKGLPVTFLGYRTDVQNIMSQLDLVVLSSLWEGLPLTPIEAFSVGKTIIATSVDGTPEVVDDNVNGLLIGPKDPDAIADRINYMISYPDKKHQMEINAKKTFDERFSFDIFAQKYIDFYRSL